MDDNSVCCTSRSSETTCCSGASSGDDDGVDELSTSLSSQLKINGGNNADSLSFEEKSPVDRYYAEEEEEEEDGDEDEDGFSEEALLAQMGYAEPDPIREYEEEEDLSEPVKKHEPINIPREELNLVSALKGSREKEGRGAEECRVSWAPDVYDPPCTADDHFAVNPKNEKYRVEHKVRAGSGKNKQKRGSLEGGSKGSKGGGGGSKDKKKAEKKHKKHGHNKYSDPG